jgi:3-isopropylmalate/(R)-2-methylmalate dehydratase small subunit
MEKLTIHNGLVVPIDRENVDTDAIIPKQFLKSIYKKGFGDYLFDEWRYLDAGYSGKPFSERKPNPTFILNQKRYVGASILLTRANFGCGSSREHAVWAIAQYGFRVLIGPSFADIFYNNCFKNGVLPIILPASKINKLFDLVNGFIGLKLTIDLERQVVLYPSDSETTAFDIDPFKKYCLLNGLDDIALTLKHSDKIQRFEEQYFIAKPWLNTVTS